MSRRRSQRSAGTSSSSSGPVIPPSVRRGLQSLVHGNEACIAEMLSASDRDPGRLLEQLEDCLRVNRLSPEMLLARFFDAAVLSEYASGVLGKSGKGSTATLAARIAREWSKPGFSVASSSSSSSVDPEAPPPSKKPKLDGGVPEVPPDAAPTETDDDDTDWRKPLFYWKGTLKFPKHGHESFAWEGSWHSAVAEGGLPLPEEYESTRASNSFRLKGTRSTTGDPKVQPGSSIAALVSAQEWILKGHYLLDQGDGNGPRKYRDKRHRLVFAKRKQGYALAAACGTTEFGNFVSAGYAKLLHDDKGELVLVLARRYIDEEDTRNAWVTTGGPNTVLEKFSGTLSSLSSADAASSDPFASNSQFWKLLLPRTRH